MSRRSQHTRYEGPDPQTARDRDLGGTTILCDGISGGYSPDDEGNVVAQCSIPLEIGFNYRRIFIAATLFSLQPLTFPTELASNLRTLSGDPTAWAADAYIVDAVTYNMYGQSTFVLDQSEAGVEVHPTLNITAAADLPVGVYDFGVTISPRDWGQQMQWAGIQLQIILGQRVTQQHCGIIDGGTCQ